MDIIYTVANWATGFVEAYCLFILCETFMERKARYDKYIYLAGVVVTGILINLSNIIFSITVLNMVVMISCEFLISFIYKGKVKIHVAAAVLTTMLSCIAEVFILSFLSVIFDINGNIIIANGALRLLGIALSKILLFTVVKYISFKFKKDITSYNIRYWVLFIVMFAVTTLTMFSFCKILEVEVSNYIKTLIISSSCGLIATTVIIMFLYENTIQQNFLISKNQISEHQFKEQIKHYNDIMMTQGQVKKIRHDLENHLLAIKAIIQKNDNDKCVEYIDTLLENMELSNSYIDTGNTVLDAIIGAKKTEAEKQGIDFNLKIRIPTMLPISQEDECIIFGNALDNAIEAAAKASEEKYVNFSLVFDKDTLVCKISNSYDDSSKALTTKKDTKNHGIGKYNIEEVLKKYNSVSRVTCENNEYIFSIIFMGLYENK